MNRNTSNPGNFIEQQPYYDIPLINDIHTHFPDLLYNIDRFESARDVLQYIRSQVSARYDRFSNAEHLHNENINTFRTHLQQPQQLQQQQQPHNRGGGGGSGGGSGGGASARIRAAAPATAQPVETPIRVTAAAPSRRAAATLNDFATIPMYTTRFNLNDLYIPTTFAMAPQPQPQPQPQQDMDNATALLTLLGMLGPLGQTPTLFEPVTVRPSAEIIHASTSLQTLEEDSRADDLCVICQERFLNGERVRTISHCQHTFHNTCILQHFENSVRCPTCRYDIRDTPTTTQS